MSISAFDKSAFLPRNTRSRSATIFYLPPFASASLDARQRVAVSKIPFSVDDPCVEKRTPEFDCNSASSSSSLFRSSTQACRTPSKFLNYIVDAKIGSRLPFLPELCDHVVDKLTVSVADSTSFPVFSLPSQEMMILLLQCPF